MLNDKDLVVKFDDEVEQNVSLVRCAKCTNEWFVINMGENEPSYCCYCGMKFKFYDKDDNVYRNLAGFTL